MFGSPIPSTIYDINTLSSKFCRLLEISRSDGKGQDLGHKPVLKQLGPLFSPSCSIERHIASYAAATSLRPYRECYVMSCKDGDIAHFLLTRRSLRRTHAPLCAAVRSDGSVSVLSRGSNKGFPACDADSRTSNYTVSIAIALQHKLHYT